MLRNRFFRTLCAATLGRPRRSPNIPSPKALPTLVHCTTPIVGDRNAPRHVPARVPLRLCATDCPPSAFRRCWNCDLAAATAADPFLSCPSCRAVQPVDPGVDYFQIFDIKREYEIKDNNLDRKYKDWQKKLHPDLFHGNSERERSYAAEQSARVTEAYRTLNKPIPRALYMLQLEGMQVDEEQTLSDPELLSEVMEIREAVEETKETEALERIQSQIQGKLERWSDSFSNAFKSRQFSEAANSIRRMIYYEKAMEEIVEKLWRS